MQIIPNSHSFGSLENILVSYDLQPAELTKEYLVVGFQNTITNGLEIEQVEEVNGAQGPAFFTVGDILTYLLNEEWTLRDLVFRIENTLKNGHDLKCERKMERTEVYKNIDKERKYQDLKWDQRRTKDDVADADKAVAEWLNYMECHLSEAKKGVYNLDTNEALEQIRKVVALGVRALEIHGCPERAIPEELLNED